MTEFREMERVVLVGLSQWLREEREASDRPVTLVRRNQVGPMPEYPYIAYTVITPKKEKGGTYSVDWDGSLVQPFIQVWSFTVQSDEEEECTEIAMLAHDWLIQVGNTYLSDRGIVVQTAAAISNRDNLLTLQYEYRQGFDATFALLNRIVKRPEEVDGWIDEAPIQPKQILNFN